MTDEFERVTTEDLVLFINACFACTGQNEFYSQASDLTVSIKFIHQYVMVNYRRLYALTLAAGINDFNKAEIVFNLLSSGAPQDGARENELITRTLASMPPPRVYRLFTRLRLRGVNNRRTRAVVRHYLATRRDLPFHAVKYRRHLSGIVRHFHPGLDQETARFLHRGYRAKRYEHKLFETFRKAHYDQRALYDLPYTVAEGLASRFGIERGVFLDKINRNMTERERLRQQKAGAGGYDSTRVPLTEQVAYLLSLPAESRLEQKESLERAAQSTAQRLGFQLGKVAAVLDSSYSTVGSRERRRRPLAITLATSLLLRRVSHQYQSFWTWPYGDELEVSPRGTTNLATPLIDALEWGAELILILSDGFENDPPGGADEVARVYRSKLKGRATIVHLNPVFSADHYLPRALGPNIATVGLQRAEELGTALGFVRLAEGSFTLSELEGYLAHAVGAT